MFAIYQCYCSCINQSLYLNYKLLGITFHLLKNRGFAREVTAFLLNNLYLFSKFLLDKFLDTFNIIFFVHNHVCEGFMIFNDIFLKFIESMPVNANHTILNLYLPCNRVLILFQFASSTVIIFFPCENFSFVNFMTD